MGRKDVWKDAKPWQKGQSGNPKGMPKKRFKEFTDKLKAHYGADMLHKKEVADICGMILTLPQSKIPEVLQDPDAPALVVEFLKAGFAGIKEALDRVAGKPEATTKLAAADEAGNVAPLKIEIVKA